MNFSNLSIPFQEYIDFINQREETTSTRLTKRKVNENFEQYGQALDIFLAYPDLLVDLMVPKNSEFDLFFIQRVVLRSMARHRQSYFTFTRGFSKSFLAFLSRYIFTMLVPGHYSFVVSGTKQQAANIAKEKVTMDLWQKFPLLQNEMQKTRVGGKLSEAYIQGQDYAEFRFTHGGRMDVVGTGSSTRGGRRHSGIFEEAIELEPREINEIILPLMNKQRTTRLGRVNPDEPHSSKIFVTTAGYKGTFAYQKLIETLVYSVIDPDKYIVLGGSYEIPLMHGLLDPEQMRETLTSPSYDQSSLDREYRSKWSGAQAGAAFQANEIYDLRKIVRAEHRARKKKPGDKFFYAIGADMAKDGSANTVAAVFKITPQEHAFLYQVVNFKQIDTTDYEMVSMELKKLIIDYEAELFVYDANGIGAALRDWINREQTEPGTGRILPAYGIINPPDRSRKDLQVVSRARTICYEVKANGQVASHINKVFFAKMGTKNLRFLVPREIALQKFSEHKSFVKASNARKRELMKPYLYTDRLEEEMRNLDVRDVSHRDNPHALIVEQRNKQIQKDYYSAVSYLVFGVHEHIEVGYYNRKSRSNRKLSDYIMRM